MLVHEPGACQVSDQVQGCLHQLTVLSKHKLLLPEQISINHPGLGHLAPLGEDGSHDLLLQLAVLTLVDQSKVSVWVAGLSCVFGWGGQQVATVIVPDALDLTEAC